MEVILDTYAACICRSGINCLATVHETTLLEHRNLAEAISVRDAGSLASSAWQTRARGGFLSSANFRG
jgi:hypothetical protein